jgi:hypothetical protein
VDDPELLSTAPHDRTVGRLDEVRAAKNPIVRYGFDGAAEQLAAPGRGGAA